MLSTRRVKHSFSLENTELLSILMGGRGTLGFDMTLQLTEVFTNFCWPINIACSCRTNTVIKMTSRRYARAQSRNVFYSTACYSPNFSISLRSQTGRQTEKATYRGETGDLRRKGLSECQKTWLIQCSYDIKR